MGIIVFQSAIMKDQKYWSNPDQFIPERFLSNGKYITTRPSAFIPFGVGRRVCLGEKLAIADLFLVLVRFIQKTNEFDITLDSDIDLEADPIIVEVLSPKPYKLIFKNKILLKIYKFNEFLYLKLFKNYFHFKVFV